MDINTNKTQVKSKIWDLLNTKYTFYNEQAAENVSGFTTTPLFLLFIGKLSLNFYPFRV